MQLLTWQRTRKPKERGINPFDHGPLHTDMWKTQGLKQALDHHGFDAAFRWRSPRRRKEPREGARPSHSALRAMAGTRRASARIVEPLQCEEEANGESIRVFPLSNWTELDIWQYIHGREDRDRAALFCGRTSDL